VPPERLERLEKLEWVRVVVPERFDPQILIVELVPNFCAIHPCTFSSGEALQRPSIAMRGDVHG
jgi:hypothetical protein